MCPAVDGQVGSEKAGLSPSNLSSMLIINPTYSALPVSLHRKLTFLFFSLPLPPLSRPLPVFFPPLLLSLPLYSKLIHVKIIDDEEYEKNKNFFLELAEPRMVDMSLQKGAVPNLFLSFSLSLALALCQCLFSSTVSSFRLSSGPSVSSLSTSFTTTFTMLYAAPPFTPSPPSTLLLLCTQGPFYFSHYTSKTPAKSRHKCTIPIIIIVSPDGVVICIKREQRAEELLSFSFSKEVAIIMLRHMLT